MSKRRLCEPLLPCLVIAALAMSLPSHSARSAEVGRIFFTPAERGALESKRGVTIKPREPAPAPIPVAKPVPVVEAPPPPAPVTLNGHIVSSNGRSTTWVNNVPRYDVYRLGSQGQIAVPTGEGNRRAPLKVGQTYDVQTGPRDSVGSKGVVVNRP